MTNRTELTAERIERAIAIQKELIRDMRSDEVDKDNRETAEEVAEIVETVVIPALRAEQEREWISVEDRLPKKITNKVIVLCKNGYIGFGHYEKFEGKETWYNLESSKPFTDWDLEDCETYSVTHWIQLPKPPMDCGRRLTEGSAE